MTQSFDYVVVGGGTAGCLLAARLSEDPDVTVALAEWGPDDEHEPRARSIRRWAEMLEGEYDFDYRSVPQVRGNSGIRQARMRILGGCSTANTMIAWRTLAADLEEWVECGATGWDAASIHPYCGRLKTPIVPVAEEDRNPMAAGCGWRGESPSTSRSPPGWFAKSSPAPRSLATRSSARWPVPPTRPSTTCQVPAGWAPRTTRARCSIPTSPSAVSMAFGWWMPLFSPSWCRPTQWSP